jgi:hypothetical protein
MTDTIRETAADSIEAVWRALLSPVEAERIGSTTLRLLAHEAAKATRRRANHYDGPESDRQNGR